MKRYGLARADNNPSNFLKAVFHKFCLVYSGIFCPIYSFKVLVHCCTFLDLLLLKNWTVSFYAANKTILKVNSRNTRQSCEKCHVNNKVPIDFEHFESFYYFYVCWVVETTIMWSINCKFYLRISPKLFF